jgi:hypothetical protein
VSVFYSSIFFNFYLLFSKNSRIDNNKVLLLSIIFLKKNSLNMSQRRELLKWKWAGISILLLTIFSTSVNAQVGINSDGTNPDASAMLDVKSTTKGILIPRMTTTQRTAISNPTTGLIIYNNTTNTFDYYNGVSWVIVGTDNLGNHTATANVQTNGNYVSSDGTSNGIFIDGNNNIGINTATPNAKFDANGTIIAGAAGTLHTATLNGAEGIVMPSGTSDYLINVQDGNGRVQHKWNATYGINESFVAGLEDAFFIDLVGNAADDNAAWIAFKHADGSSAVAGDAISWQTQMIINQGGRVGINEVLPDDRLHITDAGNGTRIRLENTGTGWAGLVAKNTAREIFFGLQGAFDANPGEFHIYDNTAGARRLVIDANGEFGIGKDNPSVKLDVNGSVNCTGGTCSSDIRWKKNVRPLSNSLSNILKLEGVNYDWRTDEFLDKNFSSKKQIGFIAQEVEKIYPELVRTDNEGYKSMDYMSMTAILVEAMKEQQQAIDQLEAENVQLKAQINRIDKLEAMLLELQN